MTSTPNLDLGHGLREAPPQWVKQTARLPIAFAQVREDPLLDLWVLNRNKSLARVMMVSSGGCTAAALVASGKLSHLHLVDPNPSQLILTRLKLHLLFTESNRERLAVLGHRPMAPMKRKAYLSNVLESFGVPLTVLGPEETVTKLGPDQAGRYECLFAELRRELVEYRSALLGLLKLHSPKQQKRKIDPSTEFGKAFDRAFRKVMALPHLIQLFGAGATANRYESFADHFIHRTRFILETQPAHKNPYLAQVLLGAFQGKVVYPWLTMKAPKKRPEITYTNTNMLDALKNYKNEMHIVHLSNILDWLTPHEAGQTLKRTWDALRPGGYVVIRQLNSTLDIPSIGKQFSWDRKNSKRLHQQDRSYFYRGFFIGRKS